MARSAAWLALALALLGTSVAVRERARHVYTIRTPGERAWPLVTVGEPSFDRRLHPLRATAYQARRFEVEWSGWLLVPTTDCYEFGLRSGAGLHLAIDGAPVMDGGPYGRVRLSAGLHRFHARYVSEGGGAHDPILLRWKRPKEAEPWPVPERFVFYGEAEPGAWRIGWALYGRALAALAAAWCAVRAVLALARAWPGSRWAAWAQTRRAMIWRLPLGLAALALLPRLYLLASSGGMMEADESAFALLALDIATGANFPWAFHYGQPYQGVLEGYLLALLFLLFGAGAYTAKLLPLLWSLALVALVYHIGRRLRGPAFGALAGLYLALPPLFFSYMSLKLWFGYLAVTTGGALLVFWAAVCERPACRDWAAAGLLAGLLLWTYPLALPAVALAAVIAALRAPRAFLTARPWAALGGLSVGLLPALLHNLLHNWETIAFVMRQSPTDKAASIQALKALVWPQNLAVVLGLFAPWPWVQMPPEDWLGRALVSLGWFGHEQETHVARFVPAWACVALGVLFVAALLWRAGAHARAMWRGAGAYPRCMLAFFALGALTVVVFVRSGFEPEPHYLLPLYPALALLFADATLALARRRPAWAAWAALVVLAVHAGGHGQCRADVLFQARHLLDWGQLQPASHRRVGKHLRDMGAPRGIAEYWVGERVTFESRRACLYSWWAQRRYPGHPDTAHHPLWTIAAAPRVGYLFHNNYRDSQGLSPIGDIDDALLLFGPSLLGYELRGVDAYTVFVPPRPREQAERRAWRLRACDNAALLDALVDADPLRAWGTNEPRRAGDWIAVDCNEPVTLRAVVLLHETDPASATGLGLVSISADGVHWIPWQNVGMHPTLPLSLARLEPPTTSRYWRVSVASHGARPWVVKELFLVRAETATSVDSDGAGIN